jgi:adenylate kinase family enzyme
MAHYLITGRGGSGKSTICKLLQSQNLPAFDTDEIPGLAQWQDVKTGQPLNAEPDGYIDFTKIAWNWNETILRELLSKPKDIILCGSSSNQKKFHHLFDKVFILTLDPGVHDTHLRERTSSYGKHPQQRTEIIQSQQAFAAEIIGKGAIPISTDINPEQSVTQIMRYINDSQRMA